MAFISSSIGDLVIRESNTDKIVLIGKLLSAKMVSWDTNKNQLIVEVDGFQVTDSWHVDEYGNFKDDSKGKISNTTETDWRDDYINYKNGGK